jgi:hypothetical protein
MADTDADRALLAAQMAEDAPRGTVRAAQPPAPMPAVPSAPVGFPPVNSLDSGYLAHRNDLEGRAALASQLSEDRPQAPGTPGAAPAAGAGDRVSDLTLSQLITGRRAASAAAVPPAADEWEWRDPLTGATASEAARGGEQIEAGASLRACANRCRPRSTGRRTLVIGWTASPSGRRRLKGKYRGQRVPASSVPEF